MVFTIVFIMCFSPLLYKLNVSVNFFMHVREIVRNSSSLTFASDVPCSLFLEKKYCQVEVLGVIILTHKVGVVFFRLNNFMEQKQIRSRCSQFLETEITVVK